ncbi:MAG TPA: hypothetical protein VKX17_08870 [Planctomycetota bacterium]|nr:hypothetical protein [Planctomycetota bacterium]
MNSPPLALFAIAIGLLIALGLIYYIYLFQRLFVSAAFKSTPATRILTVFFSLSAFEVALNYAYRFLMWLTMPAYGPAMVLGIFALLAALVGVVGWCVALAGSLRDREKNRRILWNLRVTNFQVWLQDILIGALASGLALTLRSYNLPQQLDATGTIVSGVFITISMLITFLVVINTCRYSLTAQTPSHRALFVAATLLLYAVWVNPIGVLVTWLVARAWLIQAPKYSPQEK